MRILFVDLYFKRSEIREYNWKIGGYELARELLKEYPSAVVIAPGLLTGTPAPTGGRYSIGATTRNGIHIGNVGGFIGAYIKGYGFGAIVILKSSQGPIVLEFGPEGVSFKSAFDLLGKRVKQIVPLLEGKGKKSIVVGPAGEMGGRISAVVAEGFRIVGRGMGEVFFRKGIKAMVFHPKAVEFIHPIFKTVARKMREGLRAVEEGVNTNHPCYGCPIKCLAYEKRGKKGAVKALKELGIPEEEHPQIIELANDHGVDLFGAAIVARERIMDVRDVIAQAAEGEDFEVDYPPIQRDDWKEFLDSVGICEYAAKYMERSMIEKLVKIYQEYMM